MLPHDNVDLRALEERRSDIIHSGRTINYSALPQAALKAEEGSTFRAAVCSELGRRLESAGKRLQALA